MNHESGMNHEPDPEFLEHLRWQTESALRRRDRFARPVPGGALRVARTAALALLCTFGGAGLVMAAEKIQVDRQQELLFRSNRVELALAGHRVDRAAQEAEEAEARFAAGVTSSSLVEEARFAFEQATWQLKFLLLDRDEIQLSGRTPDLSITAPARGGRDLLSERIELERRQAQALLEIAERELELVRLQFEAGMIRSHQVERQRFEVESLRARMQAQEARQGLRSDWVQGRIPDGPARRKDRLAAIELEREAAQRRFALLDRERAGLQGLVAAGAVPMSQLREIEDRMKAAQAVRELADLERQLVEEGD